MLVRERRPPTPEELGVTYVLPRTAGQVAFAMFVMLVVGLSVQWAATKTGAQLGPWPFVAGALAVSPFAGLAADWWKLKRLLRAVPLVEVLHVTGVTRAAIAVDDLDEEYARPGSFVVVDEEHVLYVGRAWLEDQGAATVERDFEFPTTAFSIMRDPATRRTIRFSGSGDTIRSAHRVVMDDLAAGPSFDRSGVVLLRSSLADLPNAVADPSRCEYLLHADSGSR